MLTLRDKTPRGLTAWQYAQQLQRPVEALEFLQETEAEVAEVEEVAEAETETENQAEENNATAEDIDRMDEVIRRLHDKDMPLDELVDFIESGIDLNLQVATSSSDGKIVKRYSRNGEVITYKSNLLVTVVMRVVEQHGQDIAIDIADRC